MSCVAAGLAIHSRRAAPCAGSPVAHGRPSAALSFGVFGHTATKKIVPKNSVDRRPNLSGASFGRSRGLAPMFRIPQKHCVAAVEQLTNITVAPQVLAPALGLYDLRRAGLSEWEDLTENSLAVRMM